MNWTRVNWLAALWIMAALTVSVIPERPTYGFVPLAVARVGVIILFYSGIVAIGRTIHRQVKHYSPQTSLDAKRLNEQLKLTSTTINGVAIAIASIFALTELGRESHPDATDLLVSAAIALQFHVQARALLGLMKDESVPTTSNV